jgi:hypothetical protein
LEKNERFGKQRVKQNEEMSENENDVKQKRE